MPTLRILSGGAAQELVNALAPQFEAQTGFRIQGEFGAVGTMAAKLRSGVPADLLILTSALIAELTREGYVASGSSADVGSVQTAIAVRTGDTHPGIGDAATLRSALLASDAIYFPDPEQATAGIHFAGVLRLLGIWDEVALRLHTFPNGATAMRELAASSYLQAIGCTQITEILSTPGVTPVGPLPNGCELAAVYTAAVCADAASPDDAHALRLLLTGDASRESRKHAGFE